MKIGKLGMGLIGLALVAMTGCQSAAKPQGDSWSAIEDRGKLVVGIDDTFAPMGFRDENNELAGYDIEMAKAVSEKLGIAFEFQTIDWSMKESELNAGNIDLIWNGYSITDTRKQQVAFSEPYLENRQLIITLADSGSGRENDRGAEGIERLGSGQRRCCVHVCVKKRRAGGIRYEHRLLYGSGSRPFAGDRRRRSAGAVCDEAKRSGKIQGAGREFWNGTIRSRNAQAGYDVAGEDQRSDEGLQ